MGTQTKQSLSHFSGILLVKKKHLSASSYISYFLNHEKWVIFILTYTKLGHSFQNT